MSNFALTRPLFRTRYYERRAEAVRCLRRLGIHKECKLWERDHKEAVWVHYDEDTGTVEKKSVL